MSAKPPEFPVIAISSNKLTAFYCEKGMSPPEKYWYVLIEEQKEKLKKAKQKLNPYGDSTPWWSSDFSENAAQEPDPELDQATLDEVIGYKQRWDQQAKEGNWIDFLRFIELDGKQREEHLALLAQQRQEYDETLTLMINTKATFTPAETEKVLVQARKFGIQKTTLYDSKCWKEMVALHKDLSTIDKIWNAVASLPEGADKYRKLLVIYTHVHTLYLNQSEFLMNEHSYTLYKEAMFKEFLHKCLKTGEFDKNTYLAHSIVSDKFQPRPDREYMLLVKTRLLEKVQLIAASKAAPTLPAAVSSAPATVSKAAPVLYSTQAQTLTLAGPSPAQALQQVADQGTAFAQNAERPAAKQQPSKQERKSERP